MGLAQSHGIDFDYACGSVHLRETGTKESDFDYWKHRPTDDYEWTETESSEMTVDIEEDHEHYTREIPCKEGELFPESYFEDQEPDDESVNSYYDGAIQMPASRSFFGDCLMVWPKSKDWISLTDDNDVGRMCDFLTKEPDSSRAKALSKKLLSTRDTSFGFEHQRNVTAFLGVLTHEAIDKDVGVDFWKSYLVLQSSRILFEILPPLEWFFSRYKSEDQVTTSLINTIQPGPIVKEPDEVMKYVAQNA